MTKIGDKEFKKYGEGVWKKEEAFKEEFKRLSKERNLQRRPQEPNTQNKRRKLSEGTYKGQSDSWGKPERSEDVKSRKEEEKENISNIHQKKKYKQSKIGEKLRSKKSGPEVQGECLVEADDESGGAGRMPWWREECT